jgi:hypothetical protein
MSCRTADAIQRLQMADKRLPTCRTGKPNRPIAAVTPTQFTCSMKSSVTPIQHGFALIDVGDPD